MAIIRESLKKLAEVAKPVPGDEQEFVAKHVIKVFDLQGNDSIHPESPYQLIQKNVAAVKKPGDPGKEDHGHDAPGESERAYHLPESREAKIAKLSEMMDGEDSEDEDEDEDEEDGDDEEDDEEDEEDGKEVKEAKKQVVGVEMHYTHPSKKPFKITHFSAADAERGRKEYEKLGYKLVGKKAQMGEEVELEEVKLTGKTAKALAVGAMSLASMGAKAHTDTTMSVAQLAAERPALAQRLKDIGATGQVPASDRRAAELQRKQDQEMPASERRAEELKKKEVKQVDEASNKYEVTKTKSRKMPMEFDSEAKMHHYAVHYNDKRVGTLTHDTYFGETNGNLHGKDLPNIRNYGDNPHNQLHNFLKSKTGQKWAANLHKYQKEEVEQIDEAGALMRKLVPGLGRIQAASKAKKQRDLAKSFAREVPPKERGDTNPSDGYHHPNTSANRHWKRHWQFQKIATKQKPFQPLQQKEEVEQVDELNKVLTSYLSKRQMPSNKEVNKATYIKDPAERNRALRLANNARAGIRRAEKRLSGKTRFYSNYTPPKRTAVEPGPVGSRFDEQNQPLLPKQKQIARDLLGQEMQRRRDERAAKRQAGTSGRPSTISPETEAMRNRHQSIKKQIIDKT